MMGIKKLIEKQFSTTFLSTIDKIIIMAIQIGTTIGTEIAANICITNKMKIGVATIKEDKSD